MKEILPEIELADSAYQPILQKEKKPIHTRSIPPPTTVKPTEQLSVEKHVSETINPAFETLDRQLALFRPIPDNFQQQKRKV